MTGAQAKPEKKNKRKYKKNGNKKVSNKSKIGFTRGPFKRFSELDPFPVRQNVKFTVSDTKIYTAGALGVYGNENIYRLNSIFDPDQTGVGHQPYGHDQMALLYKQYKCYGVNIVVEIVDPSEDALVVGIKLDTPSGGAVLTGAPIDAIKEQPMSLTKVLNATGSQRATVKQYMPMYQLMGVTKNQFNSTVGVPYSAAFGTNPVDQPVLRIALGSVRAAGAGTIVVRTLLTYHCQVYDRITLVQS